MKDTEKEEITAEPLIEKIENVLIIDGAGFARKLDLENLDGHGYSLHLADNAKDGLRSAASGEVDLLIVDDDIPEMGGIDFVNILKGAENTKDILVVIVSSSLDDELREKGRGAGVIAFLEKPFSGPELISFIDALSDVEETVVIEKDRVAVVEDSPIVCKIYAQILSKCGFDYEIISDSTKGLEGITRFKPHLILMDQNMPDINGFELTRMLKEDEELVNIPIIMVTSDTKKKSILKALELGVVDFLTKPFDEEVLLARMRAHLNNKKLFDKLSLAYEEMSELKDKLELLAITDGLTGLFNHRHFHDILRNKMQLSKEEKTPLSIILFDIDHFKKFNDSYGHKAGDKVLETIARALKESVRTQDIAARYGGEEFSVILPNTDIDVAATVAENIRANVENTKAEFEDLSLSVTVSIGVAFWDFECNEDKLVERSDVLMYESKEAGRNQVSVAKS